MRRLLFLTAIGCLVLVVWPVRAEEHVIRLVTNGDDGRFKIEPEILEIEIGDTVIFKSETEIHTSKSIPGMLPEGADFWWGSMGDELRLELKVPGLYGYKCPAAYSLGMVGVIIVGNNVSNLVEAEQVRHPPAAERAFDNLLEQARCRVDGGLACGGPS